MVSICRGASFLLPGVEKALPSRAPDTVAATGAKQMMTAGGAPHPTKQIQQGPSFCPSCGKAHRLGTTCSKSMDIGDAFDVLKGITRSGNKRGNPYHDSSTGRFSTSGTGGAGGGGGLGGQESAAPTQQNTVMGNPGRPKGSETKQLSNPAAEAGTPDLGTAATQEGPAPSIGAASPPSPGASPVKMPTGIDKPTGGGVGPSMGGGGGGTVAGKVNAGAGPGNGGIRPSEIARHEARQQENDKDIQAILGRAKEGGGGEDRGSSGPFSHEGANQAYAQKRQQALSGDLTQHPKYGPAQQQKLAGGASPGEAHEAGMQAAAHHEGMQAGQRAYQNAVRGLEGQGPAQTGQGTPPMRAAGQAMGNTTMGGQPPTGPNGTQMGQPQGMRGPGGTRVSGPPKMFGPSGTQVTGAPQGMPQPPAQPGQPQQSQSPGASMPPTPGSKTKNGGDTWMEALTKPWANYSTGSSIGGGLFSPGGTVAPTGGAVAGSAHGLLNHKPAEPQKPAAQQRQQQMNTAQGQSGFMTNQQNNFQQAMHKLSQFAQPAAGAPAQASMSGGQPQQQAAPQQHGGGTRAR